MLSATREDMEIVVRCAKFAIDRGPRYADFTYENGYKVAIEGADIVMSKDADIIVKGPVYFFAEMAL